MSEWITPKQDWHPSNQEGVTGDDFNRIEGNAQSLRDLIHTSGAPHADTFVNSTTIMQTIYIKLPPHHKAVLVRGNFYLNTSFSGGTSPGYVVDLYGKKLGSEFTSSYILGGSENLPFFDEKYGYGLDLGSTFSNVTGSTEGLLVSVRIGTTSLPYTIYHTQSSWQFTFDVVPV